MLTFVDYCKEFIIDHIYGYIGQRVYGSDFCYTITEGINADGSCTYDRNEAIDYLKEWWYDASDYFDYHKSNFGEAINPFENPEAYMVCMVIIGCARLLSDTSVINERWDDTFELTADDIGKIISEIDSVKCIAL